MRIVAGEFRGRAIDAPAGEGTRPTIDRVREALMSSLNSMRDGFEGAIVLDAFAGSGALGLEALSRGAQCAVFFERDRKAQAVIAGNIQKCKLDATRALLERRDVMKSRAHCTAGAFDLVFLDPPYAYDANEVCAMVARFVHTGDVAADAIVVYEHALVDDAAVKEAAEANGFVLASFKKYGKTGVSILRPAN